MRSLDTPEIHGYRADLGYRVYVDKALEIAATARQAAPREAAPEAVPQLEDKPKVTRRAQPKASA
jgi:arginine decarboxylase